VDYKETMENQHLIFRPQNRGRIHCHTIKPE